MNDEKALAVLNQPFEGILSLRSGGCAKYATSRRVPCVKSPDGQLRVYLSCLNEHVQRSFLASHLALQVDVPDHQQVVFTGRLNQDPKPPDGAIRNLQTCSPDPLESSKVYLFITERAELHPGDGQVRLLSLS